MPNHWLMKTEPDVFSYDDLLSRPGQREGWDGVRNYQARNFMRDDFKIGDLVFIYHSSCEEPGIAGIAEVVKEGYPDVTALDRKSPYFDEKSARDKASRWVKVDVKAKQKFKNPVTLKQIKDNSKLKTMLVVQKGSRLSIQPVSPQHWQIIMEMANRVA